MSISKNEKIDLRQHEGEGTLQSKNALGTFFGVGVGPGPSGYIPVAAWQVLQNAAVIFYPRARNADKSTALMCLSGLDLPADRLREVVYSMDPDRTMIDEHYDKLAQEIAGELKKQNDVAYLTIGDTLTYSTYSYTLSALLKLLPDLKHRTFPGITSYSAIAAELDWPIGQGKERTLILPCPDDMEHLRNDIENHDIVILMKIGQRLPLVIELLKQMSILEHCAFGSRIGLPGEYLCRNLAHIELEDNLGYLSTMLIRRT